jgi:outer membrane protein OmpA-like peptidoglycan-associated protein
MGGATRRARACRARAAGCALAIALLAAACASPPSPPPAISHTPPPLPLDPVAQQIAAIPDATVVAEPSGDVLVTFPMDLFFAEGRPLLTQDGEERLRALVARVGGYLDPLLRVKGHSDLDGSESFNLELSEDRAEVVRNFLVQAGMSPTRVGAAGFGAQFPVASNDTEEGRARNRRLEIEIQPQPSASAAQAPPDESQ